MTINYGRLLLNKTPKNPDFSHSFDRFYLFALNKAIMCFNVGTAGGFKKQRGIEKKISNYESPKCCCLVNFIELINIIKLCCLPQSRFNSFTTE